MIEVADEVVMPAALVDKNLPVVAVTFDAKNTRETFERAKEKLTEVVGDANYDVKDPEQLEMAKAHVELMRAAEDAAEAAYSQWNAPYLETRSENIKSRDDFLAFVKGMKAHINDQIQAEAKRKKAEKEARDKAQQERVSAHHAALADLIALGNMPGASSAAVVEQLARVQADGFLETRDWEEFIDRAKEEHARTITALEQHKANAEAREQLAALQAQNQAAEAARVAQAQADAIERDRLSDLQRRVTDIELAPRTCTGMTSDFIAGQIRVLDCLDTGEFAEMSERAGAAKLAALRDMRDMLESAKTSEENARLIKEQQAEQQRMLDAMTAIQAIQALTTAADGKDVKGIAALLKQAENAIISEGKFGTMAPVAQTTKDAAVLSLKLRLAAAKDAAEAAEREANRLAAEKKIEEDRLDAEREAQAARAEAARLATERVKANADRLLASLRDILDLARQAGLSGDAIDNAATLVAELSGAA